MLTWLSLVYSNILFICGWWLTNPSEKYEFVSWDYDIPNMKKWKMFQTTNQPYIYIHTEEIILTNVRFWEATYGILMRTYSYGPEISYKRDYFMIYYTTSGIGVISCHWYLLGRGHNCHKNNKITIFRSRFTIFP